MSISTDVTDFDNEQDEPSPQLTAYAQELLADAQKFYASGGTLSWTEWCHLGQEQRAVMRTAREQVLTQDLYRLAQALSGPEGLADVLSVVDGGEALVNVRLQAVTDHLLRGGAQHR